MKAQKTMIAMGVALALAASYAQAATNEDYKKVVVYGKVTLDKDSAHEWGPWTQFEAPAAGPAPVAPTLVALTPEIPPEILNPPLVPPTKPPGVDDICQAGDWCGYSVATTGKGGRGHAGKAALTHNPVNVDSVEGSGTVTFKTASFDGEVVGQIEGNNVNYYQEYRKDSFGSDPTPGPISGYGNLSVYRYATGMYRDIENEGPSRYFTADDVSGLYAVVDPTSAHGMQNLNAGNVQAHYSGDTLGYNGERLDVEADVDFGAGTINIVVNGGCDQCGSNTNSVYTVSTTEGNVIRGGVGFVVDANLEGSGYSTASFSATDVENNEVQSVSITGSGSGTFGGPGAQVLIGVNDINKTVVNGEGSYSGNYTDVFVADKVVAPN